MRLLVLLLAVACGVACTDTTSLLEDGRVADAALWACDRHEERAVVEHWLAEHAPVRFTVVPQRTLAEALGGPVRIGSSDDDVLAFDVLGRVPEAESVAVRVRPAAPLQQLVQALPPLAVVDRAPVPAPIDPDSLRPAPRPTGRRSGDFIGDILDATVAVGGAVGMAVAAPFVAMGAAVGGILDAFFGSSSSARAETVPERVPMMTIAAVDGTSDHALLNGEELRVVAHRTQEELDALRRRMLDEQQRRFALLDTLQQLSSGTCAGSACRVLLKTVPNAVDVEVSFAHSGAFGQRRCAYVYAAQTTTSGTRAEALVPADVDLNHAIDEARALAQVTTSLHPRAPSWATQHSAALPKTAARALTRMTATTKATTTTNATSERLDDLGCTLRLKPGWRGSTWPLTVQATFGRERSRTTSLGLGGVSSDAAFIVHDVGLVRYERARLSLSGHSALGGAIVTFDGSTPLVFENAAFRAVCVAAPAIDDATVTTALQAADAAVQALVDDDNGIASPRPQYELRRRRVQEAEAAVVAAAALVGFSDARLDPLLTALDAARP